MKNSIKELALATILTVLIFYTGINILPFLLVIFPLAFIILGIRNGWAYSLISAAISLVFVFIISGLASVLTMAMLSLVSIPIIYMVRNRGGSIKTILAGTLFLVLINIIAILLIKQSYDGDLLKDFELYMIDAVDQQYDYLEENLFNLENNMDFSNLRQMSKRGIQAAMALLPAIVVTWSFIVSLTNYYLASVMLRRTDTRVSMGMFRFFRLPDGLFRGILYGTLAILILSLMDFAMIDELAANLFVLVTVAFSVQGISVLVDLLIDKSKVLTVIAIIAIFILGLGSIFTILGVMEGIFHIRLRRRKKNG